VKANVVFFDANAPKDGQGHTKGVWFYDLRTNKHFTLKTRQLRLDDLKDFITCYNPITGTSAGNRALQVLQLR
jgi:type I restriction enzyme M protein